MWIQINGEQREFPDTLLSLAGLIESLSLAPQRIAVEVNKTLVPKSAWENTMLQDGDQVEIVHFVGGGAAAASPPQEGVRFIATGEPV